MFTYIQTDVWMLTFPWHNLVDCVPNSESLYKGPLTASQTGGVGSSLHLLLLLLVFKQNPPKRSASVTSLAAGEKEIPFVSHSEILSA